MWIKIFSFRSKRGVSPLIATVLLIAFAVALGAVVMNWGKGYVQSQAVQVETQSNAQLSCQSDIELNVYVLNGRPRVCYKIEDGITTLDIMLRNGGTSTIQGIATTFISADNDVFSTEIDKKIIGGGVGRFEIEVDLDEFGPILQADFTPKILVSGVQQPVLCSQNVKTIDEIYECD